MGTVRLRVLEPGVVTIPPAITSVAPVDRVGGDLGPVALRALEQRLAQSPRFEVVDSRSSQSAYLGLVPSSTRSGAALSAKVARGECRATSSSGLVALESLEATSAWSYGSQTKTVTNTVTVQEQGSSESTSYDVESQVMVYQASVEVEVTMAFTVYDCGGKVIDSRQVWNSATSSAQGPSPGDAKAAVSDPYASASDLTTGLAAYYADLIAPHFVVVERSYYRHGSPELAEGGSALEAGDWGRAVDLWTMALDSENWKTRARAGFDVALLAERDGDLETALKLAKAAYAALQDRPSARYVSVLLARVQDQAKLAEQMNEHSAVKK